MKRTPLLLGVLLFAGMTAYAQVKVTFTVDMSVWQKNGYFKPATDTVRIAGDFNSWSTMATTLTKGTGADTAKYSAQVSGVTAGPHSYKFIFINNKGVQWENDPNRSSTIGTRDTTLPVVFFNNLSGKLNHVWFKVDMSVPISQAKVTPGVTKVYLAGDMTDWQNSAKLMTKGTSDSVYSVLVDSLSSGSTHAFKFVYSAGAASAGSWEDDPNRTYQVPEPDSSVFLDYWNRQNPNVKTGTGKVNFTVDMSVMIRVGIFDPSTDSVLISAGFNGWTTTDPKAYLAQSPINDSSYFITQNFTNEPLGDKPYKYVVKLGNPTGLDTIWKDGYERPVHWGGGNRMTAFTGEASKDTSDYYDGVHPDWIIPAGTSLHVKFSVDMNPAMNPSLQAVPFDPAKDTLYWLSEEPAFARSQGWYRPSDGHMKIMKMTAQGGGIYSGTLTVKDPSFNAFEYRYEWQKGSDGSWVTEPSGFDAFAYRIRFVGQDKANHFPQNPWTMPKDTWTNNNLKTDIETNPYNSLVGVREISHTALTFHLSQNYPNPFNPTTTINYSVPNNSFVTLKVYNVLGQEVATLFAGNQKAGTYEATFEGRSLASGVYFYRLTAGSYSNVKKMVLLK
ncbi:MAG: T9SS type A sorting domain-containing protein [Bacteroidetes bacterium]|nr:T9SS type A sorting domain-containing protein [Bacteroidota bacterium]